MKGLLWFIFADHQVDYIVFLALYFFKDEYVTVNKRIAKFTKFTFLENYCVYSIVSLSTIVLNRVEIDVKRHGVPTTFSCLNI